VLSTCRVERQQAKAGTHPLTHQKMKYLQQSKDLSTFAFNNKDKCALLELHGDSVTYQGVGKTDGDAAAVRTILPMPA
jgi:hypothetical protein